MSALPAEQAIVFAGVSKFYGEVLGVNRVDLEIGPGVTSLVGPNGSGKTTLMNLMTGLLSPTRGAIRVLGLPPAEPEELFRRLGYCTQVDAFPRGATGLDFVRFFLRLHGHAAVAAERRAWEAIETVGMAEAAERKIAAYSKGMRQRIKLAQAIAHEPQVLVLDEPLNGLDPLARAELLALLRAQARAGKHVILSSHILHEVDALSDRVVLIHAGYIVAEGEIPGVRQEMVEHPAQVLLRAPQPALVASRLFNEDHVVEAKLLDDGRGLLVRTRDADRFHLLLNRLVAQEGLAVDAVLPADEDVEAVYQYLIGGEGGGSH